MKIGAIQSQSHSFSIILGPNPVKQAMDKALKEHERSVAGKSNRVNPFEFYNASGQVSGAGNVGKKLQQSA